MAITQTSHHSIPSYFIDKFHKLTHKFMIFKAAQHGSLLKHQTPTIKPLIQAVTYTYLDINLLQLPFELINLNSHPLNIRISH